MNIIKNKYLYDESITKSLKKVSDSIQIDLKLTKDNSDYIKSSVYGIVEDENLKVIKNAVVNIFSEDMQSLMNVCTNEKGEYFFLNALPKGNYNIFATSKGKNLKKGPSLIVNGYTDTKIDFILEKDEDFEFGIISGKIVTFITKEDVSNASVKLFKKSNNSKKLLLVTNTNDYGEFYFSHIPKGDYILSVLALGYINLEANTNISTPKQIVSMQLNMQRENKNFYKN